MHEHDPQACPQKGLSPEEVAYADEGSSTSARRAVAPLAIEHLAHGRYYKGLCGSVRIGRWDALTQTFTVWRIAEGRATLEVLEHASDALEEDGFFPLEEVDEEQCAPIELEHSAGVEEQLADLAQRSQIPLFRHVLANLFSPKESGYGRTEGPRFGPQKPE